MNRRRSPWRVFADVTVATCLVLIGVLGMWPSGYVLVPVVVLAVLCVGTLVHGVFVRRSPAVGPVMSIGWLFVAISAFVVKPSHPWSDFLGGIAFGLALVAVGLLLGEFLRPWKSLLPWKSRRSPRGQQRESSDEPG